MYICTYIHTYMYQWIQNVCSKMADTSDLSFSFLNSVFIPYKYFETAAHNDNIPFTSLLITYICTYIHTYMYQCERMFKNG